MKQNQTQSKPADAEPPTGKGLDETPCSVFVVVIEDRHADVDVEVWTDRDAAINRGRWLAQKYCRHADDYEEEQIADWLFYARYSCEGDSCRVIERPIHSPNAGGMARELAAPDSESPTKQNG